MAAWIDTLLGVNDELKASTRRASRGSTRHEVAGGAPDFVSATAPQQTALLDLIAFQKNRSPENETGIDFFILRPADDGRRLLHQRVGMRDIYPGSTPRASFTVPQAAIDHVLRPQPAQVAGDASKLAGVPLRHARGGPLARAAAIRRAGRGGAAPRGRASEIAQRPAGRLLQDPPRRQVAGRHRRRQHQRRNRGEHQRIRGGHAEQHASHCPAGEEREHEAGRGSRQRQPGRSRQHEPDERGRLGARARHGCPSRGAAARPCTRRGRRRPASASPSAAAANAPISQRLKRREPVARSRPRPTVRSSNRHFGSQLANDRRTGSASAGSPGPRAITENDDVAAGPDAR